jgi:hypothetical protein
LLVIITGMHIDHAGNIWFAIVDGRCGRLMVLSRTPQGRPHIEEVDRIDEVWEEREHHRPFFLGGKGRGHAAWRHEEEERARRFAGQLGNWLGEHLERDGCTGMTVFCAPSMLGALRKACPSSLTQRLRLRAADLAPLPTAQLIRHPAIAVRSA